MDLQIKTTDQRYDNFVASHSDWLQRINLGNTELGLNDIIHWILQARNKSLLSRQLKGRQKQETENY